MALTNCWECGESVSEYAETCPHCGIKSPGIKPPDPPADQAPDPDEGTTLTPDPPADQTPDPDDGTTFTPDPPNKKRGCGKFLRTLTIVIIVLAAIPFILFGMFSAGENGRSRPSPTVTPTPGPTPTWAQWKESAEEIPYDDLFRYSEDHEGKRVYYQGSVIQVMERQGHARLRVNVTPAGFGLYSDTVYLRYADPPVRVLEGDLIEFVGRMNGTYTYESVMGADITIPDLTVLSLIINSE